MNCSSIKEFDEQFTATGESLSSKNDLDLRLFTQTDLKDGEQNRQSGNLLLVEWRSGIITE